MQRRLLIASAAGAAAFVGAGLAWWQQSDRDGADEAELWSLRFATPLGDELSMATLRGRPLVLNFWATWCAPCIKEMPALDLFHRDFAARGWQVLGLAVDEPGPVKRFLAKTPVAFPIAIAGLEGTELTLRLGNQRGALPYSVVFDAHGRIKHRKLGEIDFGELRGWAKAIA